MNYKILINYKYPFIFIPDYIRFRLHSIEDHIFLDEWVVLNCNDHSTPMYVTLVCNPGYATSMW